MFLFVIFITSIFAALNLVWMLMISTAIYLKRNDYKEDKYLVNALLLTAIILLTSFAHWIFALNYFEVAMSTKYFISLGSMEHQAN